jgi:predicted transcriptional regulator
MKSGNIEALPIKMISVDKQVPFSNKAEEIIKLSEVLYTKKIRFLKRLTDNLNIEKPSKKLKSFYDYDFKTFVSELKKKKVILSLTQQDEWEDYFKAYTTEINTLQAEINQIDREIDKMVYELYGLTEDEIKIVESA